MILLNSFYNNNILFYFKGIQKIFNLKLSKKEYNDRNNEIISQL